MPGRDEPTRPNLSTDLAGREAASAPPARLRVPSVADPDNARQRSKDAHVAPPPSAPTDSESQYTLTISRLTIDKLGVKLYDKVSAVVAELIANSYDADAPGAEVELPLGTELATRDASTKEPIDKGHEIVVRDSGHGMTPDEARAFYLQVGRDRRDHPEQGARSRTKNRPVMGRKGIGKLAPFGICRRIEALSSGGDLVDGKGYLGADVVLQTLIVVSGEGVSWRLQLNNVEFATVMDKREARSRTPTETQVAASKSRRSRRKRMRVGAKTLSSGCCSTAEDAANRRQGGSREPTLAISDRPRVRVRSSPSCQNIYRVRLRSRADRILQRPRASSRNPIQDADE